MSTVDALFGDGMSRRRRLNLSDRNIKRADELDPGDRFLDEGMPWTDEPQFVVRQVRRVYREGEDITVIDENSREFFTSPGNTFIVVRSIRFDFTS